MATSPSRPPGAAGPTADPTPDPTPDVVAAIVAAVEVAWPRPVAAGAPPAESIWRFSNRWWMPRRGAASERARP